jgi:hypothetical protein
MLVGWEEWGGPLDRHCLTDLSEKKVLSSLHRSEVFVLRSARRCRAPVNRQERKGLAHYPHDVRAKAKQLAGSVTTTTSPRSREEGKIVVII